MRTRSILLGVALLAGAATARAQDPVPCSSLNRPVYGIGGSAPRAYIGGIAARLAAQPNPVTVIYQGPGACFGIGAFIDNTRMTGTATYWLPSGQSRDCTIQDGGVDADFASMATAAEQCPGASLPQGIGDFLGPVTGWSIITDLDSPERSISTEALYFIYGFGAESQAAPWTNEALIYRRSPTSAAQNALALAFGVPSARFRGVTDTRTNEMMVSLVAASNSDASIGFASTEIVQQFRDQVRTLAYQHTGQSCGYYPDSRFDTFDKQNIRDGHYYLWSTHHFFAPIGSNGRVSDPDTAFVVGHLTNTLESTTDIPNIEIAAQEGVVPQCAMRVRRTGDFTPLMSFQPEAPCGCYFELSATGTTDCASCENDTACPASAPRCRYGYCEAR